jgi:hypothetical protein
MVQEKYKEVVGEKKPNSDKKEDTSNRKPVEGDW